MIWVDVDSVLLRLIDRAVAHINENMQEEVKKTFGKDKLEYNDLISFSSVVSISPEKVNALFSSPNLYHQNINGKDEMLVFPEDGAIDLIKFLNDNNLEYKLLTHSYTEEVGLSKEIALLHHFGITSDMVIHEKDKYLYVKPDDLIIDDGLHNHDLIVEKVGGAHHYVMAQPWNTSIEHNYFSGSLFDIMNDIEKKFLNKSLELSIN